MRKIVFLCVLIVGLPALASTVVGSSTASVILIDGADVHVDEVEAIGCMSGSTYVSVKPTLDEDDEIPIELPVGTWCELLVHLKWGPREPVVEVHVDGFEDLVVSETGGPLEIELDGSATASAHTSAPPGRAPYISCRPPDRER